MAKCTTCASFPFVGASVRQHKRIKANSPDHFNYALPIPTCFLGRALPLKDFPMSKIHKIAMFPALFRFCPKLDAFKLVERPCAHLFSAFSPSLTINKVKGHMPPRCTTPLPRTPSNTNVCLSSAQTCT